MDYARFLTCRYFVLLLACLLLLGGCGKKVPIASQPEPIAPVDEATKSIVAIEEDDEEEEESEETIEDMLQEGYRLLIEHHAVESLQQFTAILEQSGEPANQKIQQLLGHAVIGQAIAAACLLAESKNSPVRPQVIKTFENEVQRYGKIIESISREKAVQYQYLCVGLESLISQDTENALDLLGKALALEPKDPFLRFITMRAIFNNDGTPDSEHVRIAIEAYEGILEAAPGCASALRMVEQLKNTAPGSSAGYFDLPVIDLPVFSTESISISPFIQGQAKIFAEKRFKDSAWKSYRKLQTSAISEPTNITSSYGGFVNVDYGTSHLVAVRCQYQSGRTSRQLVAYFRIRDVEQWDVYKVTVDGKEVDFEEMESQKELRTVREAEAKEQAAVREAAREEQAAAKRKATLDRDKRIAEERERSRLAEIEKREAQGLVDKAFFDKPRTWLFKDTEIVGTLTKIENGNAHISAHFHGTQIRSVSFFSQKDQNLMKTFAKHFPDKVKPRPKTSR